MSSIFVRPDSPPPRAPSPPPLPFTPLPSPCSRSYRKPSTSSSASSLPPDLRQERPLLTVRSCEHLSPKGKLIASHRQPKRIRSAIHPSSSRTRSLPESLIEPMVSLPHHRSHSLIPNVATSPSNTHPAPPVPPLPTFILTPAEKLFSDAAEQLPNSFHNNDFSEPDSPTSVSGFPVSSAKSKRALERTKSAGVTCLKFFALRNSLKGGRW